MKPKKGHYYKLKTPIGSILIVKCLSITNDISTTYKVTSCIYNSLNIPNFYFSGRKFSWRDERIIKEIKEDELILELIEG